MRNKQIFLALVLALVIAFPAAPLLKMVSDLPETSGVFLCDNDAVFTAYEFFMIPLAVDHAIYDVHKTGVFDKDMVSYLARCEKSPPA